MRLRWKRHGVRLGIAFCIVALAGARYCQADRDDEAGIKQDRFVADDRSSPIRSLDDLTGAVKSAVLINNDIEDVRKLKAELLKPGHRPVALLIINDSAIPPDQTQFLEATHSAFVAILAVTRRPISLSDQTSGNTRPPRQAPVLQVKSDELPGHPESKLEDSDSLQGLYVFDHHGDLIWLARGSAWQASLPEMSIVVETLVVAALADARHRVPEVISSAKAAPEAAREPLHKWTWRRQYLVTALCKAPKVHRKALVGCCW